MDSESVESKISQRSLSINEIRLPFLRSTPQSIPLGSSQIEFEKNDGIIKFPSQIEINSENSPPIIHRIQNKFELKMSYAKTKSTYN